MSARKKPTVLISSSLHLGLDLKDDLALVLVVAVLSCLYGNSLHVVPTPPIRQAKTHSDYTDHYA